MDEEELRGRRRAFGARVRELRHVRSWSQETLAEKAGMHVTYLSSVENGQRNVGLDNINQLAAALHVPTSDLFIDGPIR